MVAGTAIAWAFTRGAVAFDGRQPITANLCGRMNHHSNKPSEAKAAGFDGPIQPPRDEAERKRWQAANRAWWESAPMRYDWRKGLGHTPGDAAYFKEIDDRFLAAAWEFSPWRKIPFERFIPFDELADKRVLEIGVGHGTHAQLLASHCRAFVGIDLTTVATTMTAKRLKLRGLPGSVLQMDAERMAFRDDSFDYIWSWGVVHHLRGYAPRARGHASRVAAGRALHRDGLLPVVVELLRLGLRALDVPRPLAAAPQPASGEPIRHRRRHRALLQTGGMAS